MSILEYDWFPAANWITLNKMNKDYHNKFAPNIWCLFGGFTTCILIFLFLFKDGYYNFPVFEKPSDENIQTWIMYSCNFYPQFF